MRAWRLGLGLVIVACGSSEPANDAHTSTVSAQTTAATTPPPSATSAASATPTASASSASNAIPAGSTALALPTLGLVAIVPAGAPPTMQPGALGNLVITTPTFAVNVKVPGQFDPKTPKAAHENARGYSGAHEKDETLADGWVLTFDNTGTSFANVYRTIGGKPYFCSTAQPKAEQRDAAVAFCKSLRAP